MTMEADSNEPRHRRRTVLLPAYRRNSQPFMEMHHIPKGSTLLAWTFGRGSVIRRIWPSVILHTLFAAVVVTVSMTTSFTLGIPNVLLTVLGVVIGFVISYRAVSGYDRYFMGRSCWSDVMKNSRVLSRLIWFHVPPTFSPHTEAEKETGKIDRSSKEQRSVMAEKRMALDLVEGFAVALKHHIRGEPGIYYEDLYDLVVPFQNEDHSLSHSASNPTLAASNSTAETTPLIAPKQPPTPTKRKTQSTGKQRPSITFKHENLPCKILNCLSEWFSVLEDRGTVPGTSLGQMIGSLAAFEETLTALEKIATVPLPFVFSVHINTVWIYLFFLPFQLVQLFKWYSIGGTTVASFIYLGFIAAGEEIEQPFGYDDNDLDLDLFCDAIIHADIVQLKGTPCLNAYFGPDQLADHSRTMSVAETATATSEFDD
ncbi:Bestrophin, RFP-TM, chloride channel-domain-containing protein [Mycena floridula]|nr:Bestrophin, RFP-TM, chloride channel-domain-containing protein [Mycena floridula]